MDLDICNFVRWLFDGMVSKLDSTATRSSDLRFGFLVSFYDGPWSAEPEGLEGFALPLLLIPTESTEPMNSLSSVVSSPPFATASAASLSTLVGRYSFSDLEEPVREVAPFRVLTPARPISTLHTSLYVDTRQTLVIGPGEVSLSVEAPGIDIGRGRDPTITTNDSIT